MLPRVGPECNEIMAGRRFGFLDAFACGSETFRMHAIPIHERDHSVLIAEALRLEAEGKFVNLIQQGGTDQFRFLDARGKELLSLPVPGDLDAGIVTEMWHEFQHATEAHYTQAWEAWGNQMRSLKEDGESFPLDQQK